VCSEASTVLRAVAADLFYCWYLEIPSDNCIQHVLRCVHYHAQGFRLETFQNICAGSVNRTPELYSVSPDLSIVLYMRSLLFVESIGS
jgi:hypothetical protein